MLKYNHRLKRIARNLRANLTDSEQALWQRLRRKQVEGLQFHCQKPIGDYIVDFYSPKAKLVVEVDGSQHQEEGQAKRDARRDAYLRDKGLRVLRFNSRQVLLELDSVVDTIFETASNQGDENPPSPPFQRGVLGTRYLP